MLLQVKYLLQREKLLRKTCKGFQVFYYRSQYPYLTPALTLCLSLQGKSLHLDFTAFANFITCKTRILVK